MIRPRDSITDLPLIRWAEQLRRDKERRRKVRNRALAIGTGLALLITTIALRPTPRLVWNASASAPIGLYAVVPGAPVGKGDLVIAALPQSMRDFAARRHYLPLGVPLVKRIAAGPGNSVCGFGNRVLLNGSLLVSRRRSDAIGRPLPWWNGCHILHKGQYLLVMAAVPTSFDGRYFGITNARDVIGRAHLLWAR